MGYANREDKKKYERDWRQKKRDEARGGKKGKPGRPWGSENKVTVTGYPPIPPFPEGAKFTIRVRPAMREWIKECGGMNWATKWLLENVGLEPCKNPPAGWAVSAREALERLMAVGNSVPVDGVEADESLNFVVPEWVEQMRAKKLEQSLPRCLRKNVSESGPESGE